MNLALTFSAFIAGLLTFLAPCTLPLVPGYLVFISGSHLGDLDDHHKVKIIRNKVLKNGLFFVIGFSLVFILFGTVVSFVGAQALAPYRQIFTKLAGIFIIGFGLIMTGLLRLPFLNSEKRVKIPSFFDHGTVMNSLLLGASFAFGWTPCIGPILGSILLLAANTQTVGEGAFMLFVFSVGLAIPFLVLAFFISAAKKFVRKISKALPVLSILGGIFFILIGALLLTDNINLLIYYGGKLFSFIQYDTLLDYL